MSDDWAITPPNSPTSNRREDDGNSLSNVDNKIYEIFLDDWSLRMFCCLGEPQNTNQPFHEDSYLRRNDTNIFCEDDYGSVLLSDDFGSTVLFDYRFDKGSALLKDLTTLFKLARYSYMQLDGSAKSNISSLGKNLPSRKSSNSAKCREDIVKFLLYVRSYIQRVGLCSQYRWMADGLLSKLYQELSSFRLFCGTIDNIPDYIINYSANTAGNKCTQPSYHLFHGHLDIKWLHITLTYQIISYQKRFKMNQYSEEYEATWDYDIFENYVLHLASDLVIIALKRFDHINSNDLPIKSCFTCTCVKELWKLLQLCTDQLHSKGQSPPFWRLLNQICQKILTVSSSKPENDSSKLTLPQNYSCKQPSLFVLWLLRHLAKLYQPDKKLELKSNYELLEDSIKMCTNLDIAESQMRIFLHLVEDILDVGWEMKTEPLILFWEYFHKKLNSMFLVPGSTISGLATIGKSASSLLVQLNAKLDSTKPEKNLDSYHMFLRLLGRNLRKWQDNPRFWNQIKGRIYSKFSTAKLNALNEIGLYHFVMLFFTLMTTGDIHEASEKLQSFLKLLPIHKMDESRQKLIWKAHIAAILLFAERNHDISTVSNPLLDMVENCANQTDCIHLMRTFSEGFQDLIDRTTNLELGQYIFIGSWIPSYLSRCGENDSKRFLDSLLSLVNNLNSIMSSQLPISQDSQLVHIYNSMWEHVIPYIKNESCRSSSSYHISDIAATLTALSLKSSFSHTKNNGVNFFTFMTTHDKIDIRFLCRYLGQLSRCSNLHGTLRNHDIILIKVWLRCLILISGSDTCNDDLSTFTKFIISLPELEQLFNETKVTITPESDCFESFLIALQLKYFSLQDFNSRNKFINQVGNYFSKMEQWLSHVVKSPQSLSLATNIFNNVGQMFFKIPHLLYMKSRPNTLLQCFLEMLLLPLKVRDAQFKLHANVSDAIKSSLYLYVGGLFKLEPQNDPYVMRSIKDLITIYVPRLVAPKGSLTHSNVQFSLIKCFEFSENFELASKSIIEILCNSFLKKKARIPHTNAYQALIFFNILIIQHRNNREIIKIFIRGALESVCDVMMFCDDTSPCKKEAKDIIYFILDMHLLRNDQELGGDLMNIFSKLCHEHLAFSSRALFDLFEEIIKVAPDLVKRFLPQFEEKIKEVEFKRGVGQDRTLRKGLGKIQDVLVNIKNNQNFSNHV